MDDKELPLIVHSGHRDMVAEALANMTVPLVLLGGGPGLGKSHAFELDSYKGRMIHIQYEPMESWGLGDYRYFSNEPHIGERRVNKHRKRKARINNRLARKARRTGRN